MLPGFRFLFAAIVLSMSILMFGLGAAALLRAAHEEFASVPARRILPEPVFAQQPEAAPATLALLRVEPAAPEKAPDTPSAAPSLEEPAPEAVPMEKVETEKLAALRPDEAPDETQKPEIAAKPVTAETETSVPALAIAEPAQPAETNIAAREASPSIEAAPGPPEQIVAPAVTGPRIAATKTAALGNPAAKSEKPVAAKTADGKSDIAEIRKQRRAERARERRRQAARRARLAAQQAAATQAAGPFAPITQPDQPQTVTATTTKRR